MSKKELVWREILNAYFTKKQLTFTQKALAEKYGFSLSTVFNALRTPRSLGAITVSGRHFALKDAEKFLYIWATHRNLERDVIYQAAIDSSAAEIEGLMPAGAVFATMSAYHLKHQDAPADYDKVYTYADSKILKEIKKRFPSSAKAKNKGAYANLFVLRSDPFLAGYGAATPDAQTFVDLWNLKEWYAKDFLEALKLKLFP